MTVYRAARVIGGDPARAVAVRDGIVVSSERTDDVVDLGAVDLVPGLVDVHADSLARFEQPRTGVAVPLAHALHAFATDALLAGVTTAFLCCSIEHDTVIGRSAEHAAAVLDCLSRTRLPIRVRVHLRVDITADACVTALEDLLRRFPSAVGLVSAMDHTPGRGQYTTEEAWRRAYRAQDGVGDEVLTARLASYRLGATGIEERRAAIARVAAASGIPLAAHDDDSADAVAAAVGLGARISEFPVTGDAADAARAAGLGVVVGAPNLWRGHSHGAGPSARELIQSGRADVIASDYHLGALIPGAVAAHEAGVAPFPDLIDAMSTAPAAHVGLLDRGELTPGRLADFVAVDGDRVVAVWVGGELRLHRP